MSKSVVGVVGAGVIGTGVAQSLAQAGHSVVLVDNSPDALDGAVDAITRGVAMAALLTGRKSNTDDVLASITRTTDYEALASATFVVENATEDEAIKFEIYPRLDAVCAPETVLAANTSAVPIAKLAALTSRPDRVLGLHFMNPVPLKATVEVIRAPATSDATLKTALELLGSMGKEGIVVGDSPGFVSNRVLMLMVNEAIEVLQDGVASAEEIDAIFKSCLGHKMGPLETADLIGLDTILNTLEVLVDELASAKFTPARLLVEKVAAGELGRKTGRGFHVYGNARG